MPLTCDCYPGCWGDHARNWPSVRLEASRLEAAKAWAAEHLAPGSYVVAPPFLRLEHPALLREVMRFLAPGVRSSEASALAGALVAMVCATPEVRAEAFGFLGARQSWVVVRDILAALLKEEKPSAPARAAAAGVVVFLFDIAIRQGWDLLEEVRRQLNAAAERADFPERL